MYHKSELYWNFLRHVVSLHKLPVYYLCEVLHIFLSCVSVVNVVSMLPNVYCHQGLVVRNQGITSVWSVQNHDLITLLGKPCPSWTKVINSFFCELLQTFCQTSPSLNYSIFQSSCWLIFFRGQTIPVKSMIPMLSSIIVDFLIFTTKMIKNLLDNDLIEWFIFPLSSLN